MKTIKSIFVAILIMPIYTLSLIFKRKYAPPLLCFINFLLVSKKQEFIQHHNDMKFTFMMAIKRIEEFNKIALPEDPIQKIKLIKTKRNNVLKIQKLRADLKTLNVITTLLQFFKYEKN